MIYIVIHHFIVTNGYSLVELQPEYLHGNTVPYIGFYFIIILFKKKNLDIYTELIINYCRQRKTINNNVMYCVSGTYY